MPELNIKKMRHVEKALFKLMQSNPQFLHYQYFINLDNIEDVKGVAPVVKFTIQSDPISEVGLNGIQAVDMLEYVKCLFESLNESFPCRENSLTITKIEEAIHWQHARTRDRLNRGVEGKNKE
jgi:hypothetical protein